MNDICKRRQKRYSYTTLNRQFSLSLWIYYSVLHTAMSNWNVPLNTPVRICCSCQTTKSKLRNTGQPESRINPLCTGWPVTGCSQVVRRRLSLQNKQSISRSETIKCQARPAWQYNTERQTKSKCMLKSVRKSVDLRNSGVTVPNRSSSAECSLFPKKLVIILGTTYSVVSMEYTQWWGRPRLIGSYSHKNIDQIHWSHQCQLHPQVNAANSLSYKLTVFF